MFAKKTHKTKQKPPDQTDGKLLFCGLCFIKYVVLSTPLTVVSIQTDK